MVGTNGLTGCSTNDNPHANQLASSIAGDSSMQISFYQSVFHTPLTYSRRLFQIRFRLRSLSFCRHHRCHRAFAATHPV